MCIACVYIEHFAVTVEIRDNPDLLKKPVVIGGLPHEREPVIDCSSEAACLGVRQGMSLRQAHELCPEAVFLLPRDERYESVFMEVLAVLGNFSPVVERDSLGMAYMDASGLQGLFGSLDDVARKIASEVLSQTGLCAKIGIAGSKFISTLAATLAENGMAAIISKGKEAEFLEPLPVRLLPVSEETKRRLELLGLHTLGQIASLPLEAVEAQFGEEGVLMHQLAQGFDPRPLRPESVGLILETEGFEDELLETVDTLIASIGILLDPLIGELNRRNQVCGRLGLWFYFDGRKTWKEGLSLKNPTSSKKDIMGFLRHRLKTVRFPQGIEGIRLTLSELSGEHGTQDLLLPIAKTGNHGKLRRLFRHLRARFGGSPLKKVITLDAASRIPERRAVLTDFEE